VFLVFSFVGISTTHASFSDTETSLGNRFEAGTLYFSLADTEDFSPNFDESNPAVRTITINQEGTLGFQYRVSASDLDGPLCADVNIEAVLGGDVKYDGLLSALTPTAAIVHSGSSDEWTFNMSAPSGTTIDEACQFEIDFEGWQENVANYGDGGFSYASSMLTHLMFRAENNLAGMPPDIVLNEILPDPLGDECGVAGLYGEWVEIYNNGLTPVDLEGWYVEDGIGTRRTIIPEITYGAQAVAGPNGSGEEWVVVFLNDCVLNNTGDTIILYDAGDNLIDTYTYTVTLENKSHARYPDGTGPWVDPIPTLGGANILTEEEMIELGFTEPEPLQQSLTETIIEEILGENSEPEPDPSASLGQEPAEEGTEEIVGEEELIEEEIIEEEPEELIEEDVTEELVTEETVTEEDPSASLGQEPAEEETQEDSPSDEPTEEQGITEDLPVPEIIEEEPVEELIEKETADEPITEETVIEEEPEPEPEPVILTEDPPTPEATEGQETNENDI